MTNGQAFVSRVVVDRANHTYLGYEVLVEPKQPGMYLATFGKLGVTPLDLEASESLRLPAASAPANGAASAHPQWTQLELPAIPEPRLFHDTESISIDLFIDPATKAKLIDDIRLHLMTPISRPVPQVPTVSGSARDFSVADADLQLVQPRLTLNGRPQVTSGPASVHNSRGSLVWLYFPDHGRYILSLAPHADLGFKKAGEVRGGVLTFTSGQDAVRLESMSAIATGDAPYNLYVLHDADWQPVSERQKDFPAAGSIGLEELAALQRK